MLPSERLSLEANLRLGWQWMKYSGLHPDLLMVKVEQHHTSDLTRRLFTFLILVLSLLVGMFQLVQLIIKCSSVDKMIDTVPSFIFASFYVCNIVNFSLIWSRRHAIMELFNDWNQMESQSQCANLIAAKKFVRYQYNNMSLGTILNVFILCAWIVNEPERSYFLSHYPFVRETFGLFTISAVQAVSVGFTLVVTHIILFIPLLFFYHTTRIVENLIEEWDGHLRDEKYLRVVWQKYERILHLTERANDLFGSSLLIQHFYMVLNICLMAFYSLDLFKSSNISFSIMLLFVFVMTVQYLYYNRILSQLYFSGHKLKESVADELSRKWYELDEANRHLLISFLGRLDESDLSVRPMDLFTVNPTNLLSVSEVVMNYIIVLAQSR